MADQPAGQPADYVSSRFHVGAQPTRFSTRIRDLPKRSYADHKPMSEETKQKRLRTEERHHEERRQKHEQERKSMEAYYQKIESGNANPDDQNVAHNYCHACRRRRINCILFKETNNDREKLEESKEMKEYQAQHLEWGPRYCFKCFLDPTTTIFGIRTDYVVDITTQFVSVIRYEGCISDTGVHMLTEGERKADAEARKLPPQFDNPKCRFNGSLSAPGEKQKQ